ncbi:apolipoprotein C-I-like [Hyla sarda]|uniref:apolipoprotein C-I-like n=1 Tax=Hyla sarda TaxID=327740 RepID=UPI0024C2913D|nr:apolipoprotein C-I-like [Hyla sarda]XP_056397954.1 apolipoprotein C-I-like [Hyla sarda]
MKLLLALSVVLITLSVLAEPSSADSQEPSVKDRFRNIGESIKDAFTKAGEKTKSAFEELHKSDVVKQTSNFFKDTFQKIKDKFTK